MIPTGWVAAQCQQGRDATHDDCGAVFWGLIFFWGPALVMLMFYGCMMGCYYSCCHDDEKDKHHQAGEKQEQTRQVRIQEPKAPPDAKEDLGPTTSASESKTPAGGYLEVEVG